MLLGETTITDLHTYHKNYIIERDDIAVWSHRPRRRPEMPDHGPTPERILELGQGFWAAKALLSATTLGVFTELDQNGRQTVEELESTVGLHPRSSRDFLDALVALDGNNPH